MNDKITAQVERLLTLLADGIEKGGEKFPQALQFSVEQIALYYWAEFWASLALGGLGLIPLVVLGFNWRANGVLRKIMAEAKRDSEDERGFVVILLTVFTTIVSLVFVTELWITATGYLVKAIAPIGSILAKHL